MLEREDEDILEVARSIRPYLSELADDPEAVDRELAAALANSDAGRARTELRRHRATRRWTADFLRHGVPSDLVPPAVRSGAAPPGRGEVVRAPRFRCPSNDYVVWYRRTAGSPIPVCPTHNVRLVPDVRPQS
jgi:hypothetical protein